MHPELLKIRRHQFNNIYNDIKKNFGYSGLMDFLDYMEKRMKKEDEEEN